MSAEYLLAKNLLTINYPDIPRTSPSIRKNRYWTARGDAGWFIKAGGHGNGGADAGGGRQEESTVILPRV